MPRQPFLPAHTHVTSYAVGPKAIDHAPELATIIAKCIAMWSEVELQMALLLAAILGANNDAAVAVFLALRNARAQREALAAAGTIALTDDVLDAFEATLAVHKSLEAQRNDLAHGLYGYSDQLPDCLLWISLKDCAHFLVDTYNKEHKGQLETDRHRLMKERMFVYRKQDLEQLYDQIEQHQRAPFHLHCALRYRGQMSGENAYKSLFELPLIQAEIAKIRVKRQPPS